jgi:catechol 2,3-dioxygenase-like lactoylglutathione lyase family enzyme
MSRVQLALRVSDLEGSIAFYRSLFGVDPAKRRPGYANFAIAEPPLKLVLIEGGPDQPTVMDHLGVEVDTTDEVDTATRRLADLGLSTQVENDTTCCYALQDKVWVHGPGNEPWEVYTVKADAPDATSIHPIDAATTGDCQCGTPMRDHAGDGVEEPASCGPAATG